MAKWSHAHDKSRPVQYEACHTGPATDIVCPMYPSTTYYDKLAKDKRPLIPCEIMHAMGSARRPTISHPVSPRFVGAHSQAAVYRDLP